MFFSDHVLLLTPTLAAEDGISLKPVQQDEESTKKHFGLVIIYTSYIQFYYIKLIDNYYLGIKLIGDLWPG
jgi:hypothetical protein